MQRDEHLKSEDFFDSGKYPKISFTSTGFKKIDDEQYELTGDITIKDVTMPITLYVEYGGAMLDPYGNTRIGFALAGKVSRKQFNLSWNTMTEAGGVIVADEIKLIVNIQMLKG